MSLWWSGFQAQPSHKELSKCCLNSVEVSLEEKLKNKNKKQTFFVLVIKKFSLKF
jgi:hypothetical protein